MATRPNSSLDSRRRRRRYAGFRAAYVLWRTLNQGAALWHVAIGVAIALACALVLVWIGSRTGVLPFGVYLLPLWLVGVYAILIVAVRFVRTWRQFPELRREMREQHLDDLRAGGLPQREFRRLTWLRVQLPYVLLIVVGVLLAVNFFPRGGEGWPKVVFFVGMSAIGFVMTGWLQKWNERFRPPVEGVCPRCGYNLEASPDRCPECGMKRMDLAPLAHPEDEQNERDS